MRIEPFEQERMHSTWEHIVEMDMSESGVRRPVSLRDLVALVSIKTRLPATFSSVVRLVRLIPSAKRT